jgi:hypothetical protein
MMMMARKSKSTSGSRQAETVAPECEVLPAEVTVASPVKFDLSEEAANYSAPAIMERYDGPFPSDMFIDRDEPARVWRGDGWKVNGVVSDPPKGHRLAGVFGTSFDGYVYSWEKGYWERPAK